MRDTEITKAEWLCKIHKGIQYFDALDVRDALDPAYEQYSRFNYYCIELEKLCKAHLTQIASAVTANRAVALANLNCYADLLKEAADKRSKSWKIYHDLKEERSRLIIG